MKSKTKRIRVPEPTNKKSEDWAQLRHEPGVFSEKKSSGFRDIAHFVQTTYTEDPVIHVGPYKFRVVAEYGAESRSIGEIAREICHRWNSHEA